EGALKSDFRHLFQNLEGKSTGPKSLRGPISEKLSGCGKRPVIVFKSTDCQIPTIDRSILKGPKLVNQSIQSSRYLPEDLRNLFDPVIKRNGFFAHPEHLMLTMTQDNTKLIRELGLRRILKARQLDQKKTTVRTFMPPKLNFKAQDCSEIINWIDYDLSSSPLLKDSSDDEIKSHNQSDSVPNWDITFKTCPVHKSS
ncbi:hypothetical protein AVEN_114745-1, partial [Araneus ventricosus]